MYLLWLPVDISLLVNYSKICTQFQLESVDNPATFQDNQLTDQLDIVKGSATFGTPYRHL